jgi:hypothetical protein
MRRIEPETRVSGEGRKCNVLEFRSSTRVFRLAPTDARSASERQSAAFRHHDASTSPRERRRLPLAAGVRASHRDESTARYELELLARFAPAMIGDAIVRAR